MPRPQRRHLGHRRQLRQCGRAPARGQRAIRCGGLTMNAMTPFTPEKAGAIAEAVLIRGDLAALTPTERAKYCVTVCQSLGVNPMTKPFEYIELNGRLTLYPPKDATDQLRTIHDVSVTELIETEREGVFIVTAKVANAKGRTDAAKGAVNISGLK